MNLIEFRDKVSNSKNKKWYSSKHTHVKYKIAHFDHNFEGLVPLFKFYNDQVLGWSKLKNLPSPLRSSFDHFMLVHDRLIDFLYNTLDVEETLLDRTWNQKVSDFFNSNNNFIPFNSPETLFLLDVHHNKHQFFEGAYNFITGSLSYGNYNSFIGTMLAYEFRSSSDSEIIKRRSSEKKSIGQLRNNMNSYVDELEMVLANQIEESDQKVKKLVTDLESYKSTIENDVNKWFKNSQTTFNGFHDESEKRIDTLEQLYQDQLKLSKPADYWSLRAKKLKLEGWKSMNWLIGLVTFSALSLFMLLWLTPDGVFLNFIEEPVTSIKWSILYVSFISFLAYAIKTLSKVSFSSFHLARDAEEKEQLAYVYLALLNESSVDNEERIVILQSLFSRADSGLLKDDSGPTMPSSELVNKVYQNRT